MRLHAIRSFALSLPHSTVIKQWGEHLVFKVAGKMFLIVGLDGELIDGLTIKCLPEEFDALTEIDGVTQAPYCAKRHWVRVGDLTALPAAELDRRIRRSYELVVAKLPKKTQTTLRLAPGCSSELTVRVAESGERRLPNRRRAAHAIGAWESAAPSNRRRQPAESPQMPETANRRSTPGPAFGKPLPDPTS